MRNSLKTGLLAGTSALALALVGVMSPASAFDEVKWKWYAWVDETVTKDVTITIDIDPTGMVMVENLQVQIGNITATSSVYDIWNNQPTVDPTNHYGDPIASFDALTQLPQVVSAATAVGNNTTISADVPVQLHEGQFVFGGPGNNGVSTPQLDSVSYSGGFGGNTNLTAAAVLTFAAAVGAIAPAQIDAISTVNNIHNATVDSAATAVANNLTVDVAPSGPTNALMMGDITQFAYANLNATSTVNAINLDHYTSLGSAFDRPIVSSVATAVGNNKSITVRVPTPTAP